MPKTVLKSLRGRRSVEFGALLHFYRTLKCWTTGFQNKSYNIFSNNERQQRLRPGLKRGGAVAKSRRSLTGSCLSGPLEIIWRQLEAAGAHLRPAGGHREPKSEYLTIIYYKTSHRPHKTSLFTCFCTLGTPKSHDYPIIYMLYSTF